MTVIQIVSIFIVYDVIKELTLTYLRGRALQKEFKRINDQLMKEQMKDIKWQ